MISEEWRTCPGYPHYSVSSLGRVMRTGQGAQPWAAPGNVLSPEINRDGHARVTLFNNGKRSREFVHRLVCLAWNGPAPTDEHLVCHRDDDKANNAPTNLYWGTRLNNGADAVRNGRSVRGERVNTAKLTEGQVLEIRFKAANGALNTELAREFGVPDSNISAIVLGKKWKHVGGPIATKSRRGQPQRITHETDGAHS